MPLIRELDDVTIGQIAAGEIIERPVNVVKELVENAVDAGATRVSVTIERGGLDLIEVTDDGRGIAPDDLPLAVRRHATSKLRDAGDLERVATLGFRGEGLASIASVARVEVVSRTGGAEVGARIEAHAEAASAPEPAAAPTGTRVRVRALFDNVPVRREYLKSAATEFSRISTWLSTFSLAYPAVTFALTHDGKATWTLPAAHSIEERLPFVFGRDAAAAMIPLDARAAALEGSLRGWICTPGSDRPDRRMQLLFVNGRLLRSTLLAGAWTAGYSTFAMVGRHPYGVLFLDLPPEHVDANVHPTKSDVRLRYSTQTFDAVRRAIASTLRDQAASRFRTHVGAPETLSFAPAGLSGTTAELQSLFETPLGGPEDVPGARLRVLAQLDRTFILASDGAALLLVDQHAAHERIAYERIVDAAATHAPSEPLLVPLLVELDAAQAVALEGALPMLGEGGLDIEPFGERTFRVSGTPAGYRARPFDMQGFLDDLGAEPPARGVRERIWASLACHSVTVAGERLEFEEMTTLVERLQTCRNPMHCPHGRPTMVRLDAHDIAKLFKRV